MSILDADDLTYWIDYTSDPANLILTVTFGPLAVKLSYQIEISYYNIDDKIKKIVAPVFFLALPCGTGVDQTLDYTYTIKDPAILVAASSYYTGTSAFCTLSYSVVAVRHSTMFTESNTVFVFNQVTG